MTTQAYIKVGFLIGRKEGEYQVANGPAKKKPRIRKTAPTVRELVEASQAEPEKEKRLKAARARAGKIGSPIARFIRMIGKPLRPVGRALKWLVPSYFINSWREIRLVTWPSRKESWRLTGAVFVFALVFGALVAGVDKVLDEIFKKVILK